jgi:serine/threonine protein kinase
MAMDDFLLARVIDGRYLIRRRLGRGSAGSVYEGEHVQTKRRVAIKVLHYALSASGELRSRFEREAQSASRLSHPACVSVLDFGRIAKIEPAGGADELLGMPYIVMEFVQGELLLDRIHKGPLAAPEALLITRGLLSGLRHAHGLGIVHRDVKPENIMLQHVGEETPLVKLLDFGLAREMPLDGEADSDSHAEHEPHAEHGKIFGSPAYLSPEQAAGQPADARSDLYSLGVVLFEMVSGRPPFVRTELMDVVHDHLATPPPSPRAFVPSLSPELEAVILTLLAKPPESRFQSADELQAALATCPEWVGSGAADPGWSMKIALIEPPPLATPTAQPALAAPALPQVPAVMAPPANVPQRAPSLSDLSIANLRPTRWRGLVLVLGLLLAGGGTYAVLRHRGGAVVVPEAAAGTGTGTVRASESRLSAGSQRHLALALDYSKKFWCSAAIDELATGVHEEPELRADPQLVRMMIPCLRAKTQDKTLDFLVTVIGRDARPELESALAEELRPDVRDGVQRALSRIANRR